MPASRTCVIYAADTTSQTHPDSYWVVGYGLGSQPAFQSQWRLQIESQLWKIAVKLGCMYVCVQQTRPCYCIRYVLLGGDGFHRRFRCWPRRNTWLRALKRLGRHWKSSVAIVGARSAMHGRQSVNLVHQSSECQCCFSSHSVSAVSVHQRQCRWCCWG